MEEASSLLEDAHQQLLEEAHLQPALVEPSLLRLPTRAMGHQLLLQALVDPHVNQPLEDAPLEPLLLLLLLDWRRPMACWMLAHWMYELPSPLCHQLALPQVASRRLVTLWMSQPPSSLCHQLAHHQPPMVASTSVVSGVAVCNLRGAFREVCPSDHEGQCTPLSER